MSAHDDEQADETTRGGTLRRLPDPPSLVRAREAAMRRAKGEPDDPAATDQRYVSPPAGEHDPGAPCSPGSLAGEPQATAPPAPAPETAPPDPGHPAPTPRDAAPIPQAPASGGEPEEPEEPEVVPSGEAPAAPAPDEVPGDLPRDVPSGEERSAASFGEGATRGADGAPDVESEPSSASAPGPLPAEGSKPAAGTRGAEDDDAMAVLQFVVDDAPALPGPVPDGAAQEPAVDEPTTVLPVITDRPTAPPRPGGNGVPAGRRGADTPAQPGMPGLRGTAPAAAGPQPGAVPPHAPGTPGSAGQQPVPLPYSGGPYAPQPQPQSQPQPLPHAQPAGQQPAPYRSVPARVSVPVVRPELAGTEGKVRHGDTFARRTGRYFKRLLASSSDGALAAAVQAIQQPLPAGRQIAVTSIRGGSGKSTVASLLALTYAHHRTDPVIAVEADPALGTLPRRLGAREVRWSCADLARILDPSMQITDLIGYLLPFAGGGWLLPGSQGAVGTQLDLDTYRVVMTSMRRYFAATVVDCQTLPAEVARTALTTTQARVLVAPATVEGVAATGTVLEWLGTLHRSMLPTTVVALTHTTPDSTLDVRRSTELLQRGGAHVVTLPYDRHLAGGGAVRTDLLALETQEAATRLGAAVMDRAASR